MARPRVIHKQLRAIHSVRLSSPRTAVYLTSKLPNCMSA